MKFLLWQFAVYALAAFLLGLIVAHLWWRPRAARQARKLHSQASHVVALQKEIVDLQTAAQCDRNIVAAIAPLTEQLSVARSALTLLEAELEASALRHTMLNNRTTDLTERADRHEASASDAQRAQGEALRTRAALDQAIAEHAAARATNEQALAEALARAQSAESSLANLRRTHERLVVESRRELTEVALRAEHAERSRVVSQTATATAASVWQKAMAEASSSASSVAADDQILIVLPTKDDVQLVGATSRSGSPLNEIGGGFESDSSGEHDQTGSTALRVGQSSPDLLIELRSSE